MKLKLLLIGIAIFLLVSCVSEETNEFLVTPLSSDVITPTFPSSTPGVTISFPTSTEVSETATPITYPTPTARVFAEKESCNTPGDLGHILFLLPNGNTKLYRTSRYDLYVMSGNGCFKRLVMKDVSGSPAWSVDGERIAIGCENNTSICILDTEATLDSCTGSANEEGQCSPVYLEKYVLPEEITGENSMLAQISWAPDGMKLAVYGGDTYTDMYSIRILDMTGKGEWEIIVEQRYRGAIGVGWSPVDERLAITKDGGGVFVVNQDGSGEIEISNQGGNPEWSPDGKQIAFSRGNNETDAYIKEFYGLAAITLKNGKWEWLYEPIAWDSHYFPPQNLLIDYSGVEHRLFSWSPDGCFIVFAAGYEMVSSLLFKLELSTGEVRMLREAPDQYGYAPAWGP